MNDKVSIVVPIYNVEDYLDRCLDSIKNQSYNNFEVLLIDDCSTDSSSKIALEYSEADNRFKYYKHRRNKGLAAARNTGIINSTGKWLFFVDSDDRIRDDALDLLISQANRTNSDIVLCSYSNEYINGRIVPIDMFKYLDDNSSKKEIITLVEQASATRKLILRDLFITNNILFIETIKRSEDIPVIIPLMIKAKKITYIEDNLYYYLQREGSITHNNYKDIDLSFYDYIESELLKYSSNGYNQEIQYRIIFELVYGKIFIMIKSKRKNSEIKNYLIDFANKYPSWIKNTYLKKGSKLRYIFFILSYYKHINCLRVLIMVKEMLMN